MRPGAVDRKYAACSRITASMFIKALNELVCPFRSHLCGWQVRVRLGEVRLDAARALGQQAALQRGELLGGRHEVRVGRQRGREGRQRGERERAGKQRASRDVEHVGSGTTRVSFEARTETARRDVEAAPRRARGARVGRAAAMDMWVTANMCEYLVDVRAGGGRRRFWPGRSPEAGKNASTYRKL